MKSIQIAGLILLMFTSCAVHQPQKNTSPKSVTVFEPKGEYASMRIPALVLSKKGTLLAFCEGRINTASDWADMDILLRRSTDGGVTWEDQKVVVPRKDSKPTSNATPIVDKNGTIHLLYQRDYAQAFHIESTDDGKTWSEPIDITYAFEKFKPEYKWQVLAPGPGHAIQLDNGRIVVPVWLSDPDKLLPHKSHRPSCIATIYSDDSGKTWNRGEIIAINSPEFKNPSETVAVQLADGRVMLNIRNETANHRRAVSYSLDGATKWTKPVFDDQLYEPICMASLIKLPGKNADGKTTLLFVNPDTEKDPKITRKNLTVQISFDDGENWVTKKVMDAGFAGYSDLAVSKKGEVFCLYEANQTVDKNYKLVLIRTTIGQLIEK